MSAGLDERGSVASPVQELVVRNAMTHEIRIVHGVRLHRNIAAKIHQGDHRYDRRAGWREIDYLIADVRGTEFER